MVGKIFIKIHRILGIALSILFLMWFVTGIIMIYHHYPSIHVSKSLAYDGQIPADVLPLDSIIAMNSIDADSIEEVEMMGHRGITLLSVKASGKENIIDAQSGKAVERLFKPQLDEIARSWNHASITETDSLNEIDVWLIGAYPFKDYPVYKYSFADDDATELYLSSRTGRALQLTTYSSRFWAWVGAIPHWIYIKQLRATGRQPWTDVVLWISGIGIIMTLTGIIVGIRSMVLARRRGKWCPYKKPMFRWHHISGFFFGLIVLMFIFSGFMSLQKVPTSLVPYNEGYTADNFVRGQKHIRMSDFAADARDVLDGSKVKRLTWTVRAGIPIYIVETGTDYYMVNASDSTHGRFAIDEAMCRQMAALSLTHGERYTVSYITEYEPGYSSVRQSRMRTLPVYKIAVDDRYGSCFYVIPETGKAVYANNNSNLRNTLYTTLHSLNCEFFYHHPLLRIVLLWLMMIGGTVVSLTGVVLGYRYIRRIMHNA